MVARTEEHETADQTFAALSDSTRRDIVARVLRDEASVSALARSYNMSFAAVQKHVAVLERAGLVTKRRRGREQLVSGDVTTIRTAARLLSQYEEIWRGRIAQIEAILPHPQKENHCDRHQHHTRHRDSEPDSRGRPCRPT